MSYNFKRNQSVCPLECSFSEPNGVIKTNVSSASVRVFHYVDSVETDVLASTAMVQVAATNRYRFLWEPATLPEGEYTVELTASDDDLNNFLILIPMYVHITNATDEEIINEQLVYKDGAVTAETYNLYDASGARTNIAPRRRIRQ